MESVVTNDILADVMEKIQNPINTTKIVDYFPEDIIDNFDDYIPKFKKIIAGDYKQMLRLTAKYEEQGLSREKAQIEAFSEFMN